MKNLLVALACVLGLAAAVVVVQEVGGDDGGTGNAREYELPAGEIPTPDRRPDLTKKLVVADRPAVIAHRGASAVRPEHTRSAYELAISAGADFIETDVVITSDDVLIARSTNELGSTTDVEEHPEFTDRRVTKQVGTRSVTGWFAEDFTLDEIKTLRAEEPLPEVRTESARQDGTDEVLTLEEVLALVDRRSERAGRDVGVFVRPVEPGYFAELGKPLDVPLATVLRSSPLGDDPGRLAVGSGDPELLERLGTGTDPIATAALIPTGFGRKLTYDDISLTPDFIDSVVIDMRAFVGRGDSVELVDTFHQHGIAVFVGPISYENARLLEPWRRGRSPAARGDLEGQVSVFMQAGVDGFVADSPSEVVAAVDARLDEWREPGR